MATQANQTVFSGLSNMLLRLAVGNTHGAEPMPFMVPGKLQTLSQCRPSAGRVYASPIDVQHPGKILTKLAAARRTVARALARCRALGEYDDARSR